MKKGLKVTERPCAGCDVLKVKLCCLAFMLILLPVGALSQTRILAVGNSFSRDAVEQNLWDLAHADHMECIVGNLYIGGCPISLHVENARKDSAAYEYRRIGVDGIRVQTDRKRLDEALREEPWDVVTVQQVSWASGLPDSYGELPELVAYIRARVPSSTKILFHQTWSYARNSDHGGFKRYDNDQMKMYHAIVDCADKAAADNHLQGVIPAGTAVQFARATSLGDSLNIDGFHLNTLGRYVAACTWYEYIFGRNVKRNTYAPNELSKKQIRLARRSAHKACRKKMK